MLRMEGEGGSVWSSNLINTSLCVGVGVRGWIDDNYVCEVGVELGFYFGGIFG